VPLRKRLKCEVMLPQPARAQRRRARPTCGTRNRRPQNVSCRVRKGSWSPRRRQENLEGWLKIHVVPEDPFSVYLEGELRSYLAFGILCFGFGRTPPTLCGQGLFVAFSCKGRGVCAS
jgi:hypothetical protein